MPTQHHSSKKESSTPNPIQIQKFLGGLGYPATKKEILDKAHDEGADENVTHALEQLPDQDYGSPIAISREIGKLK